VGNVSINVYAKFCCAPLRIKKALGIFRELTTTTTTTVAFWDPPSGSKDNNNRSCQLTYVADLCSTDFWQLESVYAYSGVRTKHIEMIEDDDGKEDKDRSKKVWLKVTGSHLTDFCVGCIWLTTCCNSSRIENAELSNTVCILTDSTPWSIKNKTPNSCP